MLPALIRRRPLAGFTLIELLIVVIIIGMMIAIGVPAYLQYQAKAKDTDAKAALVTAYKAAITGDTEVNTGKFPVASTVVNDITADEPAAAVARGDCYASILNAPVKQVLVDPASTTTRITMCVRSASGAIWKLSGPLTGTPTTSDGSVVALTTSGNEITGAVRAAGVSGDGLPASDSSTGIWSAATNVIANGTAADTNGFGNNDGSATIVRDPAVPIMGTSSLKVTGIGTGSGVRNYSTLAPYATITSGTTYTASVWAVIPAGKSALLQVEDPSNAWSTWASTSATGTGTLQRYTLTFTAASSGQGDMFLLCSGSAFSFWTGAWQFEARAYATPYIRTTTVQVTRAAGRVQLPAALVNASQGWFAARIRPGFPATDGSFHTIANFGNTYQEAYDLSFRPSSPRWKMESTHLGVGTAQGLVAGAGFTNPGDQLTVVGTWSVSGGTATVSMSVNGSAFASQTGTAPAITGLPTFDIGSQACAGCNDIDGDILWFAAGTGTLSNADAATINGWGANDPARASFPAAAQATVVWDGSSANASLK